MIVHKIKQGWVYSMFNLIGHCGALVELKRLLKREEIRLLLGRKIEKESLNKLIFRDYALSNICLNFTETKEVNAKSIIRQRG